MAQDSDYHQTEVRSRELQRLPQGKRPPRIVLRTFSPLPAISFDVDSSNEAQRTSISALD